MKTEKNPVKKSRQTWFSLATSTRGGLPRGCLVFLGILAFFALLSVAVLTVIYFKARSYTSTTPAELPAVQVSDAERQDALQRVEQFKRAFQRNEAAELKLTNQDLMAFCAGQEKGRKMPFFISIDGDVMKVDASIPLKGVPGFSDRYLNGRFSVTPAIQGGKVTVKVVGIQVNGKDLASQFVEAIGEEFERNFVEKAWRDSTLRKIMAKIRSLKVEQGVLTIQLDGNPPPPAPISKNPVERVRNKLQQANGSNSTPKGAFTPMSADEIKPAPVVPAPSAPPQPPPPPPVAELRLNVKAVIHGGDKVSAVLDDGRTIVEGGTYPCKDASGRAAAGEFTVLRIEEGVLVVKYGGKEVTFKAKGMSADLDDFTEK
ncbi:MAG: hypothetical protein PHV34_17310 [Verrucomicrobiae bacterium]|nr:hypothetical protein [Verrucomicrobiae bacterium]